MPVQSIKYIHTFKIMENAEFSTISDRILLATKVEVHGNYLFFSSMKIGNGDTYWVDAKIIDNYKPKGIR